MKQPRLYAIMTLGRIKFLTYSPLLYGLGATAATFRGEPFDLFAFILGQVIIWVTHLMTHFYNEYYDLDTDQLNKHPSPWTGGSRALPNGLLAPADSRRLAWVTTLISCLLSLLMPSWPARIICWLAIGLAWGYSAPPLKFSRRGMGELITVVVLNILTPVLGFLLQHGDQQPGRTAALLMILTPLAIIEYIRMMVMNMPDRQFDAAVGKKTLVVSIGMKKAAAIHGAGLVFAYLFVLYLYYSAHIPAVVLLLLLSTAPLGALTTIWVQRYAAHGGNFFAVPFWASTHNALAAYTVLAGFLFCHPFDRLLTLETQLKVFSLYLYSIVFIYFYLQNRSKIMLSAQQGQSLSSLSASEARKTA